MFLLFLHCPNVMLILYYIYSMTKMKNYHYRQNWGQRILQNTTVLDLTTCCLSCWSDPNIKEVCAVRRSHESWGPMLPSGHALLSTDNVLRHTERSPSLSVPHSSSASWDILQSSLCECPHKEGLCGAETQTVLLFWPFVCSGWSCVGVWTVSL